MSLYFDDYDDFSEEEEEEVITYSSALTVDTKKKEDYQPKIKIPSARGINSPENREKMKQKKKEEMMKLKHDLYMERKMYGSNK